MRVFRHVSGNPRNEQVAVEMTNSVSSLPPDQHRNVEDVGFLGHRRQRQLDVAQIELAALVLVPQGDNRLSVHPWIVFSRGVQTISIVASPSDPNDKPCTH
jgi:hypothetical protein